MENKKTIIGYGYFFFLFLIIAKIAYLGLESAYNTLILDSATVKTVNNTIFNNYQELGHIISSLGATVLLLGVYYKMLSYKYKEVYYGFSFKRIFNYFNPFYYISLLLCSLFGKKYSVEKVCVFRNIFYIKNGFLRFIVFILLVFGTYKALYVIFENTLNFIVKQNLDKKYEAYYLNILKKGTAEGFFKAGYFLNIKNPDNITTSQKIMLNNIFILNYLDKNLIDKIYKHYKDYADYKAQIYLKKHKDEIDNYVKDFNLLQKNLYKMYGQYTKIEQTFQNGYKQAVTEFKKGYNKYLTMIANYDYMVYNDYLIGLKIVPEKYKGYYNYFNSSDFRKDFYKFLKYYSRGGRERELALNEYKNRMSYFFGSDIPKINEWRKTKYGYGKFLNSYALKRLALKAVLQSWKSGNAYNIFYISQYDVKNEKEKKFFAKIKYQISVFGNHYYNTFIHLNPFSKTLTYQEFILKNKNNLIKDFKNSIPDIKRHFDKMFLSKLKDDDCVVSELYGHIYAEKLTKSVVNQNIEGIKYYAKKILHPEDVFSCIKLHFHNKFIDTLEKAGFSDLKPNLTFKQFVFNKDVYNRIKHEINKGKENKMNNLFLKNSLIFITDNHNKNFFNAVILKTVKDSLFEYRISPEQFNKNKKYEKYGIKALKALFIPPFAITLSLIFGILNLLTLIGLILVLFLKILFRLKDDTLIFIKNLVIVFGILITGYYMLFFNQNLNKKYQTVINKSNNVYMRYYIKMMPQIIILEDKNYKIGVKIRKKLFNEKDYGL